MTTVLICGVPKGIVLSAGQINAEGVWELNESDLQDLSFSGSRDHGFETLLVQAIRIEVFNGSPVESVQRLRLKSTRSLDFTLPAGTTFGGLFAIR